MRLSARFGTAFGIPLHVHATFLVVPLLTALTWGRGYGAAGAAFGLVLALLVFGSVLLHELGHALAARAFGLPVSQIWLLPIGGVALLEGRPRNAVEESVIALAGPFVNFLLVGALAVLLVAGSLVGAIDVEALAVATSMVPGPVTLVVALLAANAMLGLFNLIPLFPMDGGRVLRALLSASLGEPWATRLAAGVGQAGAVALGLWGIAQARPLVVLVALFVFLAAGRERRAVEAIAANLRWSPALPRT